MRLLQANNIRMFDLPAHIPDLNPMEHVRGEIESNTSPSGPTRPCPVETRQFIGVGEFVPAVP